MSFLFCFFVALFASTLLVPFLRQNAERLQLVDVPDSARKVHVTAIPRIGGIAIAIATMLAVIFSITRIVGFNGLFIAAMCIVVFGILDDRYELSYRWKFFGQILAVLIAMYYGVVFENIPVLSELGVPSEVSYFLSFFFLLGVINAVNMTDGLDGLAAGTMLLSLAVVAGLSYLNEKIYIVLISVAMMGALTDSLRFNTYPASVFLGDTGSQFIGFMTASLAILATQGESTAYSPALPLLVLGLPILDTCTVIVLRLRAGRSPFAADKRHLHHRLMDTGFRHYEAVALIYVLQTVLISLTFLLRFESDILVIGAYGVFCAIVLGSLYMARVSGWKAHTDGGSGKDRRNPFLRHMSQRYGALTAALAVGVLFYLVAILVTVPAIEANTAILALLVLVVIVFAYAFAPDNNARWVVRLAYIPTAAIVMHLNAALAIADSRYVLDGVLVLLLLLLVLCLRLSRREVFQLDTQDLLIFCVFLLVPLMPFNRVEMYTVIRIAVLLYSLEFLLTVQRASHKILIFGCFACMSLLLLRFYTLSL